MTVSSRPLFLTSFQIHLNLSLCVCVLVLPLISKRKTASVPEAAKEAPSESELKGTRQMAIPSYISSHSRFTTYLSRDCSFTDYAAYSCTSSSFLFLSTTSNLGQSDKQPNASKRSLRHLLLCARDDITKFGIF